MAVITSTTSGNWNATSTWAGGAVPHDTNDDVVIDNGHTVTLTGADSCKSLAVNTGGIYDGDGNILTVTGESSAGWAIRFNNGQISGTDSDFTITTAAATSIDLNCASGNPRNLVINDASAAVTMETGAITLLGNLTITAGSLSTGSDLALTVAGTTEVDGTLTCNDSTIVCTGNVHGAGTINFMTSDFTANDNLGCQNLNVGTAAIDTADQFGSTSDDGGATIIATGAASISCKRFHAKACTPSTMTVTLDGSTHTSAVNMLAGTLHHLTVNSSGTKTLITNTTVGGNLTITAGTLDTGSDKTLTVTGQCNVNGGTLTLNGSTCDFGDVAFSSGTINGNTATIDLNTGTGAGWVWYQTGGTWNHNTSTVVYKTTGKHIQSNTFYNLTIECASDTNTGVWRDMSGNTLTIANDLTVKEGQFKRDLASDTLTVTGDVSIEDGGTLGHVDQSAGAENFGSLTIASGGEYIATSGTTTITGTSNADWNWTNNGTFTHNKGKVKFFTDSTSMEMWISNGDTFYDLEIDSADPSGVYYHNNIIYGDLTVTDGPFHAYTTSTTLTVYGNTLIKSEGQLINGAAQSGTVTFHGLVTNEGILNTGSGTNNFNGGVRNLATMTSDDTLTIGGTGGILEGNLDYANVNVNLDPVYGHWDGNDDAVYFNTTDNDLDSIWAGNGGCVAAWIYPKSMGESSYARIFDKNQWLFNLKDYDSGTNTARLNFSHNFSNAGADWYTTNRVVNFDVWNHVAVFYDSDVEANDPVIYINGVSVGTVSSGLTENNTPDGTINSDAGSSLYIGNNSSGTRTFDGYIMDAKVYKNVAVTATNVAKMASKINVDKDAPDMPTSGLQAWWKFNASTTADSSGNSNNLTVGTALSSPVYDAFSVNVQDNSTTTDGNFTITQGKVECLSLSSPDFERTISNKIVLASAATKTTHQTVACWVRAESIGNYRHFLGEADNKGIGFYDDGAIAVTGLGTRMKTTFNPTAGQWFHFAMTYDGSNTKVYINGEFDVSQAEDNRITLNYIGTDDDDGDTDDESWDGRIRDVRTYDFALSSDQISSLYSKSYNVTPYKWWKLDEGHITGAAANAAGSYADSGTATAILASGQQFTDSLVSNDNEALNLDGTLTIAANGTLSAPRGTLSLEDHFTNNSSVETNVSGVFGYQHNDGLLLFPDTSNQTITLAGSRPTVLYNLTSEESGYHAPQVQTNLFIERDWTNKHSRIEGGVTVTMGTDSYASTITCNSGNGLDFISNTSSNAVLKGKNSLFPVTITSGGGTAAGEGVDFDAGGSGSKVELANVNYVGTLTTGGGGVTITLTGDCEFDAVTVSSGDTLDLSGQRMFTSGLVTISGDNGLKNTTDGSTQDTVAHLITNGIIASTTTHHASLSNVVYIADGGSNQHRIEYFDFGTFVSTRDGNIDFGRYGPDSSSINVIAANDGNLSNWGRTGSVSNANSMNNFTIATGTTAVPESAELTVAGDFTTSGGLLGASCLSLDSSNTEYAEVADHADLDFPVNRNKLTLECWFKTSTNDAHQYLFDRRNGQDVFYMYIDHENDTLRGRILTSGTTSELSSTTVVNDGKWHHVALVYDGAYSGSTTTAAHKLYIDGKLEAEELSSGTIYSGTIPLLFGSRYSNDHFLNGEMDEIRMFAAAKTQAEIRADMFTAEGTNLTHYNALADASTNGLVGRWSCNAGTGHDLVSTGNTDVNAVIKDYNGGSPADYNDAWAGAGTFTYGTSTLTFSGSTNHIIRHSSPTATSDDEARKEDFYNLTIPAGETVALQSYISSYLQITNGGTLTVNGTLTDDASSFGGSNQSQLITMLAGSSMALGASSNIKGISEVINWQTTNSIPATASGDYFSYLYINANASLAGNVDVSSRLRIQSGTLNAAGYTLGAGGHLEVKGGATLNATNSIINFDVNSGGGTWEQESNSLLITGNSTFNGMSSTTNKATLSNLAADGLEVVGDVSNFDVAAGSDLTVVGSVSNITYADTTGNIRQWHHTLDTQQLLDADENGDDDLRLTKPALDNALELMTK